MGNAAIVSPKSTLDVRLVHNEYSITEEDCTALELISRAVVMQGRHFQVKKAIHRRTSKAVAIKIVSKRLCEKDDKLRTQQELAVFRALAEHHPHPCVIHFYEVFETTRHVYMVLEHVEGCDLFDWIQTRETALSEEEACRLFAQLMRGLVHLHSLNICHRDIKPESLLCTSHASECDVKIANFSRAVFAGEGPLSEVVGGRLYRAPEVYAGHGYSLPCDVWSAGVVLYILLSGVPPFDIDAPPEVLEKEISNMDYTFPVSHWSAVSEEAREVVLGLLQADVSRRMTAEQCLAHPWVQRASPSSAADSSSSASAFSRMLGQMLRSGSSVAHRRSSSSASSSALSFARRSSSASKGGSSTPKDRATTASTPSSSKRSSPRKASPPPRAASVRAMRSGSSGSAAGAAGEQEVRESESEARRHSSPLFLAHEPPARPSAIVPLRAMSEGGSRAFWAGAREAGGARAARPHPPPLQLWSHGSEAGSPGRWGGAPSTSSSAMSRQWEWEEGTPKDKGVRCTPDGLDGGHPLTPIGLEGNLPRLLEGRLPRTPIGVEGSLCPTFLEQTTTALEEGRECASDEEGSEVGVEGGEVTRVLAFRTSKASSIASQSPTSSCGSPTARCAARNSLLKFASGSFGSSSGMDFDDDAMGEEHQAIFQSLVELNVVHCPPEDHFSRRSPQSRAGTPEGMPIQLI